MTIFGEGFSFFVFFIGVSILAETQFNTGADWKSRGFNMRIPPLVLVAYDPAGDGRDRDAVVMISREEHQQGEAWDPDFAVQVVFRILMVHQMGRDLEFPDKLAMLLKLHRELARWGRMGRCKKHVFCVETNGVGYAMGSSLRSTIGNNVVNYKTVGTASTDKPFTDNRIAMPRLAGLDNLRVLAETHCLKVSKSAPGKEIFEREMGSFVWARPGRPEAIQGQTDDCIMAAAGACWIGTKVLPLFLKQMKYTPVGRA